MPCTCDVSATFPWRSLSVTYLYSCGISLSYVRRIKAYICYVRVTYVWRMKCMRDISTAYVLRSIQDYLRRICSVPKIAF